MLELDNKESCLRWKEVQHFLNRDDIERWIANGYMQNIEECNGDVLQTFKIDFCVGIFFNKDDFNHADVFMYTPNPNTPSKSQYAREVLSIGIQESSDIFTDKEEFLKEAFKNAKNNQPSFVISFSTNEKDYGQLISLHFIRGSTVNFAYSLFRVWAEQQLYNCEINLPDLF